MKKIKKVKHKFNSNFFFKLHLYYFKDLNIKNNFFFKVYFNYLKKYDFFKIIDFSFFILFFNLSINK